MIRIDKYDRFLCAPTTPIRDVLMRIQHASPHPFQAVVDADGRVLGTVTDGDVRRAMLRGVTLDDPVSAAMHRSPVLGRAGDETGNQARLKTARFLPVVDDDGRIVAVLLGSGPGGGIARALVMAGGFGRRLGERTRDTPKPLLAVGERPILEHVLAQLEDAGVASIAIAVHYLAKQIEDFVAARESRAQITLIHEPEPLGTAGALALLAEPVEEPVLVVNGDVLCRIDYRALHDFHMRHGNDGTLAVARYEISVPYGVVRHASDGTFAGIEEKPVFSHFVAAGIYYLSPEFVALVPTGRAMDMPELLELGRGMGLRTGLFPVHEYWKDIALPSDLATANIDHVADDRNRSRDVKTKQR